MLFSAWELCGPCGNPSDLLGPAYFRVDRPTVKKASIEYREDRVLIAEPLGHTPGAIILGSLVDAIARENSDLQSRIAPKHHDGPKSQLPRDQGIARRKTLIQKVEPPCLGPSRSAGPGGAARTSTRAASNMVLRRTTGSDRPRRSPRARQETDVQVRDLGLPQPGCGWCISPWVDLEAIGETMSTKAAADPTVQKASILDMARMYLNGADPRSPLAAPIYADLTGLAPLLIQVGAAETLLDDAIRLAKAAGTADVRVDLQIWPEMIHVWHLFHPELSAGRRAIDEAGSFIRAMIVG
jgi:alpha/beta hydrolase family protein